MYFFGSILKKETLNMYLFSMLIWAYFLSLKIYINSILTPNSSRLIKDTFTTFTSKDRMADEIAKTLSKHKWGTLFSVNFICLYIVPFSQFLDLLGFSLEQSNCILSSLFILSLWFSLNVQYSFFFYFEKLQMTCEFVNCDFPISHKVMNQNFITPFIPKSTYLWANFPD